MEGGAALVQGTECTYMAHCAEVRIWVHAQNAGWLVSLAAAEAVPHTPHYPIEYMQGCNVSRQHRVCL